VAYVHVAYDALEEAVRFFQGAQGPLCEAAEEVGDDSLGRDDAWLLEGLGERVGMPYQTLINMYLRDCAESRKTLRLQWRKPADAG